MLMLPPSEPRSAVTPVLYRKAWAAVFPVRYENPVSWPVEFNPLTWNTAPPRVGMLVTVLGPPPHPQPLAAVMRTKIVNAPPRNLLSPLFIIHFLISVRTVLRHD